VSTLSNYGQFDPTHCQGSYLKNLAPRVFIHFDKQIQSGVAAIHHTYAVLLNKSSQTNYWSSSASFFVANFLKDSLTENHC
jgi:hypothetical protein